MIDSNRLDYPLKIKTEMGRKVVLLRTVEVSVNYLKFTQRIL